mmetsp:Transcript_9880/g.34026  ORF Transcript_9880/g.34026 Transcript_9880/m.34026 type:complete len:297 (+) Transcript_9880:220-1110(+)
MPATDSGPRRFQDTLSRFSDGSPPRPAPMGTRPKLLTLPMALDDRSSSASGGAAPRRSARTSLTESASSSVVFARQSVLRAAYWPLTSVAAKVSTARRSMRTWLRSSALRLLDFAALRKISTTPRVPTWFRLRSMLWTGMSSAVAPKQRPRASACSSKRPCAATATCRRRWPSTRVVRSRRWSTFFSTTVRSLTVASRFTVFSRELDRSVMRNFFLRPRAECWGFSPGPREEALDEHLVGHGLVQNLVLGVGARRRVRAAAAGRFRGGPPPPPRRGRRRTGPRRRRGATGLLGRRP